MPRGAEYAGGPVSSDNAIESGETNAHGTPVEGSDKPVSEGVDRSHEANSLPAGIEEMEDEIRSGQGSQGLPKANQ